jgi:hypothetical protein
MFAERPEWIKPQFVVKASRLFIFDVVESGCQCIFSGFFESSDNPRDFMITKFTRSGVGFLAIRMRLGRVSGPTVSGENRAFMIGTR